jgi:hypothetical protein
MPSFKGQLSEPNLMALIAFLKQYGASKPSPAEPNSMPIAPAQ